MGSAGTALKLGEGPEPSPPGAVKMKAFRGHRRTADRHGSGERDGNATSNDWRGRRSNGVLGRGSRGCLAGQSATRRTISLQIERTIAAPQSTVFGLWTRKPWPGGSCHPTRRIGPSRRGLRPAGGQFSLRLVSKGEFYDLEGTFRAVFTPQKLAMNWRWDKNSPLAGSPGNVEVTV